MVRNHAGWNVATDKLTSLGANFDSMQNAEPRVVSFPSRPSTRSTETEFPGERFASTNAKDDVPGWVLTSLMRIALPIACSR